MGRPNGMAGRAIELAAAEALLNAGVRMPLTEIRLPLVKRPIRLRVTLKRPCLSGQIRFARTFLQMGVTADELAAMDKDAQMRFMAVHGAKVCRMVAETLCVGPVKERFVKPVAWVLGHCVEQRFLLAAAERFVAMMGTGPFVTIIRLAERTNPLRPRLSRDARGS